MNKGRKRKCILVVKSVGPRLHTAINYVFVISQMRNKMGSFDEKSQAERFEAIRQATSNYYGVPKWILRCKYCGELLGRIKVAVHIEGPTKQELEEIDAILQA